MRARLEGLGGLGVRPLAQEISLSLNLLNPIPHSLYPIP